MTSRCLTAMIHHHRHDAIMQHAHTRVNSRWFLIYHKKSLLLIKAGAGGQKPANTKTKDSKLTIFLLYIGVAPQKKGSVTRRTYVIFPYLFISSIYSAGILRRIEPETYSTFYSYCVEWEWENRGRILRLNWDGNLKFGNSQDYAQKPQLMFAFMNSASVFGLLWLWVVEGGGGVTQKRRLFGLQRHSRVIRERVIMRGSHWLLAVICMKSKRNLMINVYIICK